MSHDLPKSRKKARPRKKKARNTAKPLTVSINRACEILDIGRTTLYELIKKSSLTTTYVGSKQLVIYDSIEELIGL